AGGGGGPPGARPPAARGRGRRDAPQRGALLPRAARAHRRRGTGPPLAQRTAATRGGGGVAPHGGLRGGPGGAPVPPGRPAAVHRARRDTPASGAALLRSDRGGPRRQADGATRARSCRVRWQAGRARARAAVYPAGQPQERVLTLPSFLIRYGPGLVDALEQEVARWAGAS